MKNIACILMWLITFISCQSDAEKDMQNKKITFERIDKKYSEMGFTGISEIYKITKQIPVYSKVLNEKKNKFDSNDHNITTDSILISFLRSYNLTEEEFKRDIDSVNSTRSYVNNYLEYYYNKLYDDTKLKLAFYQAFKNNPKIDFNTASKQCSSSHFKDNEKPTHGYSSNSSVEEWMSDYNGSIKDLKEKVISSLHNPDSFEHVETSYNDKGKVVKVRMKFRATNKFDAKVLNQADAILNIQDGTVSDIQVTQ